MVGQALDSKSSVTELCLADNELGVKGAMFVMRKAGYDVQGVNGQCGETNMASIFPVFRFRSSNTQRRVREGKLLTLSFFSIPIHKRVLNPHKKSKTYIHRYT